MESGQTGNLLTTINVNNKEPLGRSPEPGNVTILNQSLADPACLTMMEQWAPAQKIAIQVLN